MKYVQAYTGDLEKVIERGGDQALVERAISEYNLFDEDAYKRWWSAHPAFRCAVCGGVFKTNTLPSATSEITCGSCNR